MKTIVLYFSQTTRLLNSDDYSPAWIGDDIVGWIRAELCQNKTLDEALEAATPRKGEMVLNSVEIS